MIKIWAVKIVLSVWNHAWCRDVMSFIHTSVYYRIKTHYITTSSTTLQRVINFNCQDFNHYPFSTYIYITCTILTEIIIIFNCYGVMVIELTTFVPLYCCNNSITLKMAITAAETYWWEYSDFILFYRKMKHEVSGTGLVPVLRLRTGLKLTQFGLICIAIHNLRPSGWE
jgi:hypothetical protein